MPDSYRYLNNNIKKIGNERMEEKVFKEVWFKRWQKVRHRYNNTRVGILLALFF